MAWDESRAWLTGTEHGKLYATLLEEATAMPARNAKRTQDRAFRRDACGRCRARAC